MSQFEIETHAWPFLQLPTALVMDKGVTDGAKVTFAALLFWGRRDGKAWPTAKTLAEARGSSERSVMRHTALLQEAGWITKKLRPCGRTVYMLHSDTASAHVSEGGDTRGRGGMTHVATEVEEPKRKSARDTNGKSRWATSGLTGEEAILIDGLLVRHARISNSEFKKPTVHVKIKDLAKREGVAVLEIGKRWSDWVSDREGLDLERRYEPGPHSLLEGETLTRKIIEARRGVSRRDESPFDRAEREDNERERRA